MSRPHLLLALALGLPGLGLAADPTPAPVPPSPAPAPTAASKAAPTAKEDDSDAEIIFLTGLPAGKAPELVSSYARKTYVRAELVKDTLLRQFVQLALSRIEDQPEKALQIRQEHLSKLADFFLDRAMEAQAADKPSETLRLAEIAVRCNPANPKAKLFYANFLHGKMGRTDDAIQTMRHGLEFLEINDKGDVSGVRGVCIEIKNHAKMDLGGWLQELLVEIVNAKAETGAVVHKRKGKSDVGQWYATMTVDMWIYLLKEAGYGETKTTRQGLTD